jgi:DNA-binding response OmpR family regulator
MPIVAMLVEAPVRLRKKTNSVPAAMPSVMASRAETVISALEDAEDYKAFEAAIIADYDVQSAVERELVLRLASLLWRLRRATTMETGLFEFQAEQLSEFRQARQLHPASREVRCPPKWFQVHEVANEAKTRRHVRDLELLGACRCLGLQIRRPAQALDWGSPQCRLLRH